MHRDVPVVAVGVRAIDVGYFNLKYTCGRKLLGGVNTVSTGLFPALAPRVTTKELMKDPDVDACIVNVRGVEYVVGPASVVHTSPSEQQAFDLEYSATDRYHALMLGGLSKTADDAGAGQEFVIDRLVLGLPLNTYHQNVEALRQRAIGEHVMRHASSDQHRRVTVKSVHVMVQPHGALLGFGVSHPDVLRDNRWTLVIDPGGGTLDWFVARGTTPNWARSGAYPKAMLHCAYSIADQINPRWRTQYEIVETIDLALRTRAEVFQIGPRQFRTADFRGCVDAVLEESLKHMVDKTGPLDSVSRILLTGGGAPVFHEFLLRRQPELAAIVQMDPEPVFANVRGFQLAGEVLERSGAA
jgi:plasmid segregation protein ParM